MGKAKTSKRQRKSAEKTPKYKKGIIPNKGREEAMAELTAIVESTGDAILRFSPNGKITGWNPSAERMYGYKTSEILGKHVTLLAAPDTREGFSDRLEQVIAKGHITFERVHVRKDGSRFDAAVTASVIKDSKGKIIAFSSINRDITEFKALDSALRQAQKMEAVGRLAGGIAHDFNNMLTPIMGFAEIGLEELKPGHPAAAYFTEIITAATNARDLTRQLMSFTQKKGLQLKIFNLNDLISQAMPIIESVAGETIKVSTSFSSNAWTVKADPAEVQQIVMNLVVNAKDAMPDGGSLSISTINQAVKSPMPKNLIGMAPGNYVVLSVTDTGTGIGMSQEIMSHLFEPFFTTKKQGHGVGLSLATSFAIAKQYGGLIAAESKPGSGTTMKVFLPRSLVADGPATVNVGPAPRGTESVLLVEDDASVRRITAQMLTRLGYKVTIADNGKKALAMLRKSGARFEIVLTDFVMPGMSGKKLAEQLSKLHKGTRIVYMSGYVDDATANAELSAEGGKVLRKPFGMQALAIKMRDVLDK